jgi:hypothetical protein
VSHGQEDGGAFALDFRDERYTPFEGAGAISSWRIELPAVKQFDYNTIHDVVLHMRYTAIAGSGAMRERASNAVKQFQRSMVSPGAAGGLAAVYDLKNDYPTGWSLSKQTTDSKPTSVDLNALQNRLPFWAQGREARAKSISLYIAPAEAICATALSLKTPSTETVKLASTKKIGAYGVIEAEKADEIIGDWQLTVTKDGRKARVERMFLVLQYTVR